MVILLACAYMAASITWSSADLDTALLGWARHARLLTIPIVCYLLADKAQAMLVLRAFTLGQVFVVLSSWALVFGVHVPWATGLHATDEYAVFGSYLEQSISQSVLLALLWFQRDTLFGQRGRWIAILLALLTLALTVGVLRGRTGYVVTLAMLALACAHAMPKKWWWVAILVPCFVFALAMAGLSTFRHRMLDVASEVTAYSHNRVGDTSSAERLVYWSTSLQAIAANPLLGHGSGSWNVEYRKLGGDKIAPPTTDNPHQLFLLWAVEGGLLGVLGLVAVLWSLVLYAKKMEALDGLTLKAMVLALVVSGMFNSMIFGIGMGDFFCIGLGIALGLRRDTAAPSLLSKHDQSC